MWLFLLFIVFNILFKNVEPLSIFVKISWREIKENKFEYPHHLTDETKERFDLKLTGTLRYFKGVNGIREFLGKTDAYDNYHFNGNDNIEENLTNEYKLEILINRHNIIEPIIVQNNSIIYVVLNRSIAKYKILTVNQEDLAKIINFFENPLRFVQFFWDTRSAKQLKIRIGCKNETPIFELNKFSTNEKETENSRKKYKSECVRIKICPDNLYNLHMIQDFETSKQEIKDLTCTTALYEKGVNFYKLDFTNIAKKPSCILLNNSRRARKSSKVSHAEQTLHDCKSYANSENTEENKIEQIFEQNNGWNSAQMITNLQKHPNGDDKEDKIRKLLRAKYDEAKRKKQTPKASAAADEVNYEFDLNVISERMAERCFNIFNKETTNIDLCQVDSKNKSTKVGKKRKGHNESNSNKKSKILLNSAHNTNQTNKPKESVKLFQVNDSHQTKGKQTDLTNKHPETISGGTIHETYIDADDEFLKLLDCLDDSHDEHAKVDSPTQISNGDTSVQVLNYKYFTGGSQFNDKNNVNGSNSVGSDNEFFANEADGLTEDDLKFLWNDEESQDMNPINSPAQTSNSSH